VTTVDNSGEDLLGFVDFTALFQRAMKRKGLTQRAIAEAIGRSEGHFSTMLTSRQFKPEDLKAMLKPLGLSPQEYAVMYRKGIEEYAPDYVRELLGNFMRFHELIMSGHHETLPSFDMVVAGQMPRRIR
jgi:transcriptional regulator with XRE-family HTH domain